MTRDLVFQGYESGGGRIPAVVLNALERIWVQPGFLGEPLFGDAGRSEVRTNALDSIADHVAHKNTSGCATQLLKHTAVGFRCVTRRAMERTPDERREILRLFIQERKRAEPGFKVARWAKGSAVNPNSIYNFINGHSQALDPITYGKLARTANVKPWQLSGDEPDPPSPTSVWVSGFVEAGTWQEAVEWDSSRWYALDVPVPSRFRGRARALEVRGSSMNIEYPEGSIAVWVEMLDFRPARHDDDVVIYAYGHDDGRVEATIKRYREIDGKQWLWPVSNDPKHQTPVDIEAPGDEIVRIEIKGIVIGGYRPKAY